ncbi:MAG TPA: alpha/beta hydrolase [Lachnospiraceae bacterium]|nr:alpha/beta hydrolase [Lachnospiraceae bacterium]
MKAEFFYPSRDGMTQIHAIEWVPEGNVKAVLQISHGMVEYIDRYDEFAEYLAGQGYYVVGHDHLGHGKSVTEEDRLGYFHETRGNDFVIGDIHELRMRTMKKYPEVPYFMLGHSMGSFLLRQYIQMYGKGLAGVLIVGTGYQPAIVLHVGRALCRIISLVKDDHVRCKIVDGMAFGGYNKRFEPARTSKDWLTKDEAIVDKYLADPWCSFMFTINAYYHMFGGMLQLTKRKNLKKIPKELPVYFIAGKDDPVGNFGKGVEKVYHQYRALGIKDVSIRLYETDRHEILNETDRQQVFKDIWFWLELKRKRRK